MISHHLYALVTASCGERLTRKAWLRPSVHPERLWTNFFFDN
jgi:hypothetical protein